MRGVEQSLQGVERGALRLERGMGSAHLSTGKLRQELLTLTRQVTSTSPVVTQLGGLLTDFAVGGSVGLVAIAGIAAIAAAYNKITEGARKAREENDKLITSLEQEVHLKSLGPGGTTVDEVKAAQEKAADIQKEILRLQQAMVSDTSGGPMMRQHAAEANRITEEKINKLYVERQSLLNLIAGGQSIVNEKIKDAIPKAKQLVDHSREYRMELERLANLDLAGMLGSLLRLQAKPDIEAIHQSILDTITPPSVSMPNTGINDGLTKEQIKTREKMGVLIDDANKNAEKLSDVISSSAIQGASIIVSALNIGGGGKGSGIGGALGSTAGFAAGFAFGGPVGGAIGSTVGNIFGSLIGGLFDHHKKAIDANTAALNRMNSLLNEPTGFKVEYYRDRFSTARMAYRNLTDTAREEQSRGGTIGLQLAGA